MPCYKPLDAYRGALLPSGKRAICFVRKDQVAVGDFKLPCGQCIGCRLERSRQWAMRCIDEASLFDDNSFITLTYNDANLPKDKSLHPEDFQLFMKRLRQDVWRRSHRRNVRFFHCGEYGSVDFRPHYHGLLFNLGFKDRYYWKMSDSKEMVFRSPTLERLWPYGFSAVGDVTFRSAAYVARYILEKVTGQEAELEDESGLKYYDRVDKDSGEIVSLHPEYVTMSRRPGIGKAWYDKFKLDMYPSDFRIINGLKMKPARYYDSQYDLENPGSFREVKRDRLNSVNLSDNTWERLRVKEECKKSRLIKRS